MANPPKIVLNLLKQLDPYKEAGSLLMVLNALGMIFAALSNTFAAASDKNTSAQDKKILVPAGLATGAANIGLYYAMTKKLIKGLEKSADDHLKTLKPDEIDSRTNEFVNTKINKAQKGTLFGFGKKSAEYIDSMKNTLLKDAKPTDYALDLYKNNFKAGAGVLGAFIGAVVGCSILTPVIRDVSAYVVQKIREKKDPELQNKPYKPYFDPAHLKVRYNGKQQPLSLKTYMAFTNGTNMKI